MMKPTTLMLALCFLFSVAKAQKNDVVEMLKSFNKKSINEFVYVQTDRDVYFMGDTIWFSAYIRTKTLLVESKLSSFFYIKLCDKNGEITTDDRYIIQNSQVSGQIAISKKLSEGYYYIVAYTGWMENFQAEEVFRKKIYIRNESEDKYTIRPVFGKSNYKHGDTVDMKLYCYDKYERPVENVDLRYLIKEGKKQINNKTKTNEYISFLADTTNNESQTVKIVGMYSGYEIDTIFDTPVSQKVDVTFYPEGGSCANGLNGSVAYKAIYNNGMAAKISGKIKDEAGNIVAETSTEHEGMGSFTFTPEKGKRFFFEVENQYHQQFEIPKGEENNWQLSILAQDSNFVKVEVKTNSGKVEKAALAIQIRGYVFNIEMFDSENTQIIEIPTEKLPIGICVLTLFNSVNIPVAERLVFVNKHKNNLLEMHTRTDTYSPRDSTILHINLCDANKKPISGKFSLSVFDETFGSSPFLNTSSVMASAFLSTEIKGRIVNPNYYFNQNNKETTRHLDLLLLTQGWRKYRYDSIETMPTPRYRDVISGQIKRFKLGTGLVPTKAEVNIYSGFQSNIVKTDNIGNFYFTPVIKSSTVPEIFISTEDSKGHSKYSISMDEKKLDLQISPFLKKANNTFDAINIPPVVTFNVAVDQLITDTRNNHWIEEVEVRAKKIDLDILTYDKLLSAAEYVKKINSDILSSSTDLESMLLSSGLNVMENGDNLTIRYKGGMVAALILVNDIAWKYRDVKSIPMQQIEKVVVGEGESVANNFSNIMYVDGKYFKEQCPVVVLIYLKKDFQVKQTIFPTHLIKFQASKKFYEQKYESEMERAMQVPDLRRTIYWNPTVEFNKKGYACVKFFNADRNAKIECSINGFSSENKPIHTEYFYKVAEYK